MKKSISEEKEQDLRIDKLSFTYEEPVIDLADWYGEETNNQTSAEKTQLKNISFL